VGLAGPPGGPAVLPLWRLSPNGHMADDLGVLGQFFLEKMFKLFSKGFCNSENIFCCFCKKEKVLEKFQHAENNFQNFNHAVGKTKEVKEIEKEGEKQI
jgi:hypothetical protein